MAVPNPPLTVAEMLQDPTTLTSLGLLTSLIVAAYGLSSLTLSKNARASTRFLFIWHIFDSLVHFVFEGSFLYNCLFVYQTITTPEPVAAAVPAAASSAATAAATATKGLFGFLSAFAQNQTVQEVAAPVIEAVKEAAPAQAAANWLGYTDRLYGANYAEPSNPWGALWRVYAQADARWGVADAGVVSLELLTVLIGGPLSLYIAYLLARNKTMSASFWMIVLATGELYGGFMTFVPEWLTGSQALDTSNWMYTYVYLALFNGLWVVIPIYAIRWAYKEIRIAFTALELLKKGVEATQKQQS